METCDCVNVAARKHAAELRVYTHVDKQRELRHQTTQLLQILTKRNTTIYFSAMLYQTNLQLQCAQTVSVWN